MWFYMGLFAGFHAKIFCGISPDLFWARVRIIIFSKISNDSCNIRQCYLFFFNLVWEVGNSVVLLM